MKFTIASQHGVIPGLVFPQVVHTRTEKELWVFWVLVDLGRQAFLNPTIGRCNSRSVMSWPPNWPYFPPPLKEPGQDIKSGVHLYVSAWRMCRLISTISASGFFHLICILFIPSQALPGGSATISKALLFNRRHFSVYSIPWTAIWTHPITCLDTKVKAHRMFSVYLCRLHTFLPVFFNLKRGEVFPAH